MRARGAQRRCAGGTAQARHAALKPFKTPSRSRSACARPPRRHARSSRPSAAPAPPRRRHPRPRNPNRVGCRPAPVAPAAPAVPRPRSGPGAQAPRRSPAARSSRPSSSFAKDAEYPRSPSRPAPKAPSGLGATIGTDGVKKVRVISGHPMLSRCRRRSRQTVALPAHPAQRHRRGNRNQIILNFVGDR